ncbi:hypothetical protein [Streptomyces sp. NPDC048332]|uniref:hypothetical protein n=1 Tax=Streptomyces sp. NPDC048332 TaxID=3154619 RepID=UPI003446D023
MNVRRINAAARVILAAQKTGTTLAAPLAMALEAEQLLQFPEATADLVTLRTDAGRYRTAWRMARTRALSTGGAADRYAARAGELQTALQESVAATLVMQLERNALRARVAELEKTTPSAGAEVTAAVATARTVVLTALARALREQPTAPRILQGFDELGEAVVCDDPAEVRSWVDGISLLAGLPTTPDSGLTYYRASHESIVVGRCFTEAVARRRCETLLSSEHPDDSVLLFDWIGDESYPDEPWELTVQINGGDEQPTGYVVHPLRIEAEFDPDAEW